MDTASNWGYECSPWESLLYNDSQIAAMLAPFAYFKGTLKLRITVAGHPYNFGKLIASYYPSRVGFLEHPVDGLWQNSDNAITQLLSRDHAWLDTSTSEGCVLTCPLILDTPYFNLSGNVSTYDDLGKLQILMPSALWNLNGSTQSVRLCIYAWVEDVELRGNTTKNSDSVLAHQMAEENTHVISDTATAVADAAGALSEVPIVGTYARAVDVAARAGASVAKAFGFSRPTDHTPVSKVQQRITENMINVNGPSDCSVISFDARCEHTLDPTLAGCSQKDELAFDSLGNRDHYITRVLLRQSDNTTDPVRAFAVSPGYAVFEESSKVYSPISLVAEMFSYWYSTVEYTFTICSSAAHRGTYVIAWDPMCSSDFESGFVNSITFNLGETNVVKFKVPMLTRPLDVFHKTAVNGGAINFANGNMIIKCIKPAQGLNGTTPDISVIVTARYPDIRFGGMDQPPNFVLDGYNAPLALQMMEEGGGETTKVADEPSDDETLMATLYHGESIRSARALARSFAYVGTHQITTTATETSARLTLCTPTMGGYGADGGFVRDTPSGNSYSHACSTLTSLLWSSFAGRSGSTRYKVVIRHADGTKLNLSPARVFSIEPDTINTNSVVIYEPAITHGKSLHTLFPSDNVISLQAPTNRNTLFQPYGKSNNVLQIEYDLEASTSYYIDVYAADGEDTNYVCFRGVPMLDTISRNPA